MIGTSFTTKHYEYDIFKALYIYCHKVVEFGGRIRIAVTDIA